MTLPVSRSWKGLGLIRGLLFVLLGVALFAGAWNCAPPRQVIKPQPTPVQTPEAQIPPPPALSEEQILGLQRPPNMLRDPESGQFAQAQVMQSFWKLRDKAAQDGWHLILVSGHRSFKNQVQIWNHYDSLYRKTDGLDEKHRVRAVMSLVSVPGLSRHHWGTDMDISEVSLRGQLVNVHPDTPQRIIQFYNWMEHNAPEFGFCKVYLGKKGAVRDEPWHWSYFPYSQVYQQQFFAMTDFHRIMNSEVDDVHYLMKNFKKVFKEETKSINTECSLEIQN